MKKSTSRTVTRMTTTRIHEYQVTCDRCGFTVTEDNLRELFSDLVLLLDPSQCVNYSRVRQYCQECADIIWKQLNEIIGADPETVGSDREGDDDW